MDYSSEKASNQALRIVDANLNRIGEGLRLLEDIYRLVLNDATFSRELKALRHELATRDLATKGQLLQARDSRGDIGINIEVSQQTKERDMPSMVIANSRRVQESLRVLEELAKIAAINLDSARYKNARFKLYDIEKDLLSRLLRKDKADRINGLYAIIDTQFLKDCNGEDIAAQILEGGASIIQLRDKDTPHKELLPLACRLKNLCAEKDALFIMNDCLDIALAADADGLHIGQEDLPLKEARRLLPIDRIIGCSVDTVEQAKEAAADGADYLAVGAIYPTPSKRDVAIPGLKTLKEIRGQTSLPLVAIGGIDTGNAAEVISAGADSVAVISAIMQAESAEEATRQMIEKLEMNN